MSLLSFLFIPGAPHLDGHNSLSGGCLISQPSSLATYVRPLSPFSSLPLLQFYSHYPSESHWTVWHPEFLSMSRVVSLDCRVSRQLAMHSAIRTVDADFAHCATGLPEWLSAQQVLVSPPRNGPTNKPPSLKIRAAATRARSARIKSTLRPPALQLTSSPSTLNRYLQSTYTSPYPTILLLWAKAFCPANSTSIDPQSTVTRP